MAVTSSQSRRTLLSVIAVAWRGFLSLTLRDFWWFEFLSSVALLTWGAVAISSPDRLSARHFGPLLHYASESSLEHLVLCVACLQLWSVASLRRPFRIAADIAASFLTGMIFLAIIVASTYPQPGIGYYGVAWVGNLLAAFKLIRKKKDA